MNKLIVFSSAMIIILLALLHTDIGVKMKTEFNMRHIIESKDELISVGRYGGEISGRIFIIFPNFTVEISNEVAQKLVNELLGVLEEGKEAPDEPSS